MFRLRATNNRNGEAPSISSFKPSKPINQTNYLYRRNPTNIALHRENSRIPTANGSKIPLDGRIIVDSVQKGLPNLNQRSQTSINIRSKPSSGRSTGREIENSRPLPRDCNCILCLNKILTKTKRAKTSVARAEDKWTVDSRHFLETLERIQLSVKVNKNYSSKDLNNSSSDSDQKCDSQSSEKPRYLHKSSRIKLWKPNDVDKWVTNHKIDSEADTDFSDVSSKESSSSLRQRDSPVDYELNKIAYQQEYPTNPPTSPLSFFRIPVALPIDD